MPPGPVEFGTRIPTPCTRDVRSTFMTVAARRGKESSLDCSCMRTLSPTCKPFQANGVMRVSVCSSVHRGERIASPRRDVRHGGHSHHVACAAASRFASPGKDNRHRPQRREGGGRSTSAVLSARIWPALVSTWVMSLVPGHVEHIDAVQRRATVRRSHRLRPTASPRRNLLPHNEHSTVSAASFVA